MTDADRIMRIGALLEEFKTIMDAATAALVEAVVKQGLEHDIHIRLPILVTSIALGVCDAQGLDFAEVCKEAVASRDALAALRNLVS